MNKDNIILNFQSKNKLKLNSIKLYSLKLDKIFTHFNIIFNNENIKNVNLFFKNNFLEIMKYITKDNRDTYIDNNLAFLNAICFYLKHNDPNNSSLKFFNEKKKVLNDEKIEKYNNNLKNKNFIEYSTLLNQTPPPDFKNDSLKDIIFKMTKYISVRFPLRLALMNIEIATSKKSIDNNKNYFYKTSKNNKMFFIMNNFKNVKSLKPQEIEIEDEEQKKVFNEYLKFLKKEKLYKNLIYNYYLTPLIFKNESIFYGFIKRNLNLTLNDIRKSYTTHLIKSDKYQKLTNYEKEKEHNKILHSFNSAHKFYNKV